MSFGGHLRTLFLEAGLSRAELARRAGVPVSTLRRWEHGWGCPGVPAFLRPAESLGVPAERLAECAHGPVGANPEPVQEREQDAEEKARGHNVSAS